MLRRNVDQNVGSSRKAEAPKQRRYEVTYLDAEGRRRWQTVPGLDNLDDAEALLEGINGEKRKGAHVSPQNVTFDQAADEWFAQLTVGERTRERYEQNLRLHLRPRFGRRKVQALTGDDFARLIAELRDEGKAPWTTRNVLTTASSLYRWAAGRRKLVATNPVRALEKGERPKVRKRPGRTLQPDEIRALLDSATSDRYRTLIATAIFTGCRLQELLALRWHDVDGDELHVRHQLTRKGGRLVELKSEAGERTIALMPELAQLLREHRAASRYSLATDYVFATAVGTPMGWRNVERRAMDAAFAAAVKANRIPAGRRKPVLHDCRHTFGSMLIAAGEDVYTVSRAMGHANVSTTLNVYAGEIDRARNAEQQRSRMSGRYGNLMETTPRNQPQPDPPEMASVSQIRK